MSASVRLSESTRWRHSSLLHRGQRADAPGSRSGIRCSKSQCRHAISECISDRLVITHCALRLMEIRGPSTSPGIIRTLMMHQAVMAVCSTTAGHNATPTRCDPIPNAPRTNAAPRLYSTIAAIIPFEARLCSVASSKPECCTQRNQGHAANTRHGQGIGRVQWRAEQESRRFGGKNQ